METALKILSETKEKLIIDKRICLKRGNTDIADKINEEILDISIAIKELIRAKKSANKLK